MRFGLTEHNKNNAKTFGFKLDDDDGQNRGRQEGRRPLHCLRRLRR